MSARTVVITGGTGKLGRVLVADRLKRGDAVVAFGMQAGTIEDLSKQHQDAIKDRRLHVLRCDLTAADAAQQVIEQLQRNKVQPAGFVHAARGLAYLRVDKDAVVAREDFNAELTVAVVAAYELTMALAQMPNHRLESVVYIGSQYGIVAPNAALYDDLSRQSFVHYGVAKAALVHLAREMAVRLAPRVRVNCVSFGGVEGRADADFVARYARLTPAGRMLRETEVTGPVEFLLSEASSGTTGQNLIVDGGWTVW